MDFLTVVEWIFYISLTLLGSIVHYLIFFAEEKEKDGEKK